MKVEILIVSYAKDKEWLVHCLRSIEKFASGFSGVTLAVPEPEYALFKDLAAFYGCSLAGHMRGTDERKWHLEHQIAKCMSDRLCPDADFILHTDSDCVFSEPVTPDDYFVGGKPIMLVEEFSRLQGCPWKKAVDSVLKMDAKYETMRRHPAVHYRDLYADLRNRIETLHNCNFAKYVKSLKADFPWGFTEFNMLGQIVLEPKWRDKYHVIDMASNPYPHPKLIQFWSHGGMDHRQHTPNGLDLTPNEVFAQLGV